MSIMAVHIRVCGGTVAMLNERRLIHLLSSLVEVKLVSVADWLHWEHLLFVVSSAELLKPEFLILILKAS